ncbi:MAG: glycosyltransferase, partial [Planctomycetales bacterium]|nr:glycosyltransferase [Planctomycetales bacterium]
MDRILSQPPKLAVVVSGFPRYSETFALNEILSLHRRGMLGALVATKAGDGKVPHPGVDILMDQLHVLPAGDVEEQSAALAEHTERRGIAAYHAYFAHLPLQVAVRAAHKQQLPYGFSTHAKDARKVPLPELAQMARGAACAVGCNTDVTTELSQAGIRVDLIPHGVDTKRFRSQPLVDRPRVELLAVGRFVAKKGFDILLEAVAKMRHDFHLTLVGSGADESALRRRIGALGLGERVDVVGAMTHETLPAAYAAADIVVVPSVVDVSGDRDGLPNVVLEAMACGRPIVASRVGAIGSAIESGEHGLLVQPGHADDLAAALDELAASSHLRQRFAYNAR